MVGRSVMGRSEIGENKEFAASVLDNSHCSANAIVEVLANYFLITGIAADVDSSEFYEALNKNKVIEEVEVLVLLLKNNGQMKLTESLDFLSNELRLFCWHGCPFTYLLQFHPENIVVIDLYYSHIKQLWTTPKCLRRLKVMQLRYCCNLTTTPDFSEITNLEVLDLEGCVNMVTLHPSIGMLKNLVVLNMRDCRRARSFPSKMEMNSLQVLNLSGCLNVNQVPQDFWSRGGLQSLLEEMPDAIRSLSFLKKLNLEGNSFTSLPGSLGQLSHLDELTLDGCKKLEVCGTFPRSLLFISAYYCTSLIEVSGTSKGPNQIHGCSSRKLDIMYDGNSIPEWFTNRSTESHLKVELPSDWCFNKFRGYGTCVVFKRKKPGRRFCGYSVKNFDGAFLGEWLMEPRRGNESYMIWLHYTNSIREWEEAKNFVTFFFEEKYEEIEVKECGVRFVYYEDLQQDTNLSILQDLPTLSQHGGAMILNRRFEIIDWSW
ncbi:NB-ARC domains-containing protein [Tanacetum coccineum]|uniref:NB-ARC domains-containing protein n=1 Tax=Tanacetum coccineum TaxID=301880 RepID=A0ABQ5HTT7_9ASTR